MGNKYRQDLEFIYWLRLGIVLIFDILLAPLGARILGYWRSLRSKTVLWLLSY